MNRTYVSKRTLYYPQGVVPRGKGTHPEEIETDGKPSLRDLLPGISACDSVDARRYRVRFAKRGRAAYLGHLDLMENLARAFKRAGLRAAYTHGYHPKPKFSFGPALMTGAESDCEFFDVELLPPIPGHDLTDRVNEGLPEGISLLEVRAIDRSESSLGALVRGAVFEVTERLPGTLPDIEKRREALNSFLAASRVEVHTPKKTYDVRRFVTDAAATARGFRLEISMSAESGSAKPTDVVRGILGWIDPGAPQVAGLRLVKTATLFEGEGALAETGTPSR